MQLSEAAQEGDWSTEGRQCASRSELFRWKACEVEAAIGAGQVVSPRARRFGAFGEEVCSDWAGLWERLASETCTGLVGWRADGLASGTWAV